MTLTAGLEIPRGAVSPKMHASGVRFCLVLSLLLVGPMVGWGQKDFINTEKLSDRVRLFYWVGTDRRCNLTTIMTQKGLVIIDTEMSPRIMALIKQRIEQSFGRKDWAYVINTHAHDNHAGGNVLFKGVPIVAHANLAEDMQWLVRRQTDPDIKQRELERAKNLMRELRTWLPQYAQQPAQARLIQGEIKFWELHSQDLEEGYAVVPPTTTFIHQQTLDCGDVQLELVFFGKGHSRSDILIYVPQERLLVTGAIVYQRAQLPEIGNKTTREDLERFLTVLDRFLAPEVQIVHVVPGHSPPLRKPDLALVRDYYQRMLSGVRAAQQAHLTFEQTKARLAVSRSFPAFRDPPKGSWSYGTQDRNLRNLWRILSEESPPKSGTTNIPSSTPNPSP